MGETGQHQPAADVAFAFGRVVRELREARGRSQERLAFESGLHRTYISLVERGLRTPKLDTVFILALALGIEPTELVRRTSAALREP